MCRARGCGHTQWRAQQASCHSPCRDRRSPAILSSANSKNSELEGALIRAESSHSEKLNSCEDNCLSSSDIASAVELLAEVMRSILMFVIAL